MREPFESMERWYRKGRRFALAEALDALEGTGPREPGALMAVNELGDVAGSVSGGCVEGAVVQAALAALESGEAKTLVFSEDGAVASPETWGLDVPCGAGLAVRVRPFDDETLALMRRERQREQAAPRVVCVGAVHVTAALCGLARQVGYRCVVVDPRGTFTQASRIQENADEVLRAWPQEALPTLSLTPHDAVCALSHDAKIDTPALACALRSEAGYIGCLGHAETLADRRAALVEGGFSKRDLARVHAPIGMFLGGREPEEIALSALAQIQAVRCGRIGRVADLPGCTLERFSHEEVARIAARREELAGRALRLDTYRDGSEAGAQTGSSQTGGTRKAFAPEGGAPCA